MVGMPDRNQKPAPRASHEAARESATPLEKRKALTPEARRALQEAEERRARNATANAPREIGGPKGPEPVRYGDWERGGRAFDF